ncbi:hypothetical protein [Methylicorpusculum sp.]|uniref:hypothetical protein n=1 Tax=Methylicorpusculum sp. TaxID=2713644 RepID=UPI00272FFAAD|nr:hypothetical protein [Methylicorpusculum sp.]MDP2178964.1 hypothetical protein [Methylicorpusculum sp.]MDP3528447.1 hypothetical protein [Methylicorpusculum sp.]MDZ4149456.1 hypothetical protein [Methylicorpusculum sp.]
MKNFKKLVLSLAIACSMGAASTTVMAETDAGRITYAPDKAIDLTVEKIKAALVAAESSDAPAITELTKEAIDMSKEINANDKVDIARSRANLHIKKARSAAKVDDIKGAKEHLEMALKAFQELKGMI